MRPFIFYIVLLSLFATACKKKESTEVPQPIKELIQTYNNCTCQPFIDQYKWRNKIIYLSSCNGPLCNCVTWYYDEEGRKIEMAAGYSPDDFRKESQLLKNIWTCK